MTNEPKAVALNPVVNSLGINVDWMPDLRPSETILYTNTSNSRVFLTVCVLGLLFFGYGTLYFRSEYYVFDTLTEACGDQAWRDCGKFYSASKWFVPVGIATVCFTSFVAACTLIGWIRQIYVLTTERALVRRFGPIAGVDSVELRDAVIRRRWIGVQFRVGWRKVYFFLDSSQSETVMGILNQRAVP